MCCHTLWHTTGLLFEQAADLHSLGSTQPWVCSLDVLLFHPYSSWLSRCSIIPLISRVYSLDVLLSHPNREFTLLMCYCSTHNLSLLPRCAIRFTHNLSLLSPCVTVPPMPWVYSLDVLFNHPYLEFTLSVCYCSTHTLSYRPDITVIVNWAFKANFYIQFIQFHLMFTLSVCYCFTLHSFYFFFYFGFGLHWQKTKQKNFQPLKTHTIYSAQKYTTASPYFVYHPAEKHTTASLCFVYHPAEEYTTASLCSTSKTLPSL